MNELTDIQRIELEMYKEAKELCERHGIPFFALGGTLLGAVRHQGFIPWDDDIDIAIPKQDYGRFVALAKEELPAHLYTKTYLDEKESTHPRYNCQILDLNTKVALHHTQKTLYTNIWLDVFPLDGMPSGAMARTFQKYRLLYERMKVQFSMYEENAHQHRSGRPLHERALMKFREVTGIGSNWDSYELICHIDNTLNKYPYEPGAYCVNMFGAYKFREMFPVDWFGEGIELPFEDTTVPCPVEYDKVLTQMYGDYMQLPPEEDRANHHCMEVLTLDSEEEAAQ